MAVNNCCCTGYNEIIMEDNSGSLGIRDYVIKPVRVREITEKIRKVLDQK